MRSNKEKIINVLKNIFGHELGKRQELLLLDNIDQVTNDLENGKSTKIVVKMYDI